MGLFRQNNMDMLTHYADLYDLHQRPETAETDDWGPPEGERPEDRPAFELSTFYSVAFGTDGEVLAADNGGKTLYTKDALAAVAREILAGGKASGRFNNLFYLRRIRPDYTLVAMMDITVAESGLTSLLRNFLAVGGSAIGVMFLLAVHLSRRIIRPLEENDRKQKQFISDASHEQKRLWPSSAPTQRCCPGKSERTNG